MGVSAQCWALWTIRKNGQKRGLHVRNSMARPVGHDQYLGYWSGNVVSGTVGMLGPAILHLNMELSSQQCPVTRRKETPSSFSQGTSPEASQSYGMQASFFSHTLGLMKNKVRVLGLPEWKLKLSKGPKEGKKCLGHDKHCARAFRGVDSRADGTQTLRAAQGQANRTPEEAAPQQQLYTHLQIQLKGRSKFASLE